MASQAVRIWKVNPAQALEPFHLDLFTIVTCTARASAYIQGLSLNQIGKLRKTWEKVSFCRLACYLVGALCVGGKASRLCAIAIPGPKFHLAALGNIS